MKHVPADQWQRAVRHLLAVRRPEQAEQVVRRRLAAQPEEAEAHRLLVLTLLKQSGRTAEALPIIRRAIALDPQDSEGHYYLSFLLAQQEQLVAALEAIREALRLASFNPAYLGYQAAILNAQQQAQPALEAANQGLAVSPGHLECLLQRIRALRSLHEYEAAAHTIGQLARWHPTSFLAHYLLGEEAERQGQTATAAAHLQEALRLQPDSTPAQQKLALLLLQLGQAALQHAETEVARSYFWQAWHLQPDNREVRQEIEQLARSSYWLKRQLLQLDAWSEDIQQGVKKGKPRALLHLYLIMVPLMAVFCLPLLLAMLVAAVQWRQHPDVRLLRQQTSRWAAIGEVALMVGVAAAALLLLLGFRLWLDTVSGEMILGLLVLVAVVVGICLLYEQPKAPPSQFQ